MKRVVGVLVGLGAMLISGLHYQTVVAQQESACLTSQNVGAVTLSLPPVETGQDYALWVRLQSPTSEARLLMQLNQSICLTFSSATQPEQWGWYQLKSNGNLQPIRFGQNQGNTLTLFGVQDGLRVDKVIVSEPECVPVEFGTNCKTSIEAKALERDTITVLPPPVNGKVQGKVYVSNTPADLSYDVKSVSYVVGGRTIQTHTTPEPLDTTLLENGKHTVIIETKLLSGGTITESTVIDVDNPITPLTPVTRWYKLHASVIKLTAIGIASIIMMLLLVAWMRSLYQKRRSLKFHGF